MNDPIESGRTLPARSLDFWFDYTCPYAYLGSTQARGLAARMGVSLGYNPLLLGGVFAAVGTAQNLFATRSPQRSAHENADMQRWAKHFGVPLRMPAAHPMRSVEALRATLVTGVDPAVVDGLFRAYWVDNRPVSDPTVIAEVVTAAGHDPAAVLRRIDDRAIKDELRERTTRAVGLGIFGVPAWVVDGEHLYWGQDRLRFVEGIRVGSTISQPAPLDFYWDFSSPFAYLAATQIDALAAKANVVVQSRPVLLGGLFRSIGMPDVPLAAFSAAKQAYTMKDLERWVAYWNVPFRWPSRFPTASLKALRVYLALPEEARASYRASVFRACWADDRDITDDAVLAECIGTGASDALARASSDAVKSELRAANDAALARGVFGVPTFITGDELVWGQDRLEMIFSGQLATGRHST